MSYIRIPSRYRLHPTGPLRLRTPYGGALACVDLRGQPLEIARGSVVTIGATATFGNSYSNQFGGARRFVGTASSATSYVTVPIRALGTGDFTWIVLNSWHQTWAQTTSFYQYAGDLGASSSGLFEHSVGAGNMAYWNGTNAYSLGAPSAGQVEHVMHAWRRTGAIVNGFADGRRGSVDLGSCNQNLTGTTWKIGGKETTAALFPNNKYSHALLFPWALSDGELLDIGINPYGLLFEPDPQRAYFDAPAGTASLTADLDATESGSDTFAGTASHVAAGTGTLSLTDIRSGRILQRIGTAATLTLSGTYTGSPTSIEARVVDDGTSTGAMAWTTLTNATISGGSFTGDLEGIPQGGWYNLQARFGNITTITSNKTGKLGVGALFAFAGQSNAFKAFEHVSPDTPSTLTRQYTGTSGLAWTTTYGVGVIPFANAMQTALGVPVGVIQVSESGTSLSLSQPNSWLDETAGSPYANCIDYINSIASVAGETGKVEALLWFQGEYEAAISHPSSSVYYDDLTTLFGRLRTEFAQPTLPILISLLPKITSGGTNDAQSNAIRDAQILACADNYNHRGAETYEIAQTDGLHFSDAGQAVLQTRNALRVQEILGESVVSRGPYISSATLVSNTTNAVVDVNVTLRGGTTITPASSITGFLVTDGGVAKTITTAARQTATSVRLTLSGTVSSTVIVQYMYGYNFTITAPVYDDGTYTLPLEQLSSDGVEAQPLQTLTADLAATESGADTFAGTGSLTPLSTISAYLDAIESGSDTFAGTGTVTPAATGASVTITLVNESGTAQSGLSSLKWAWFDEVTPNLFNAPTDQGSAESTDGSGVLTIPLPNTTKTSGQTGWLIVTNSDGTTNQSPAHRAFSGPVAVS